MKVNKTDTWDDARELQKEAGDEPDSNKTFRAAEHEAREDAMKAGELPERQENKDRQKAESENSNDSSDSGSGCFVTTATLYSIGKDDRCEELNIFRRFRDEWLVSQKDGKNLINEYYSKAPKIVKAISLSSDHLIIYNNLWENSIRPCLEFIKDGRYEEAKNLYIKTMIMLKSKYK